MTAFAAVIPRRSGELPLVDVGVAIPALRQLDFVEGVQPLGKVASFARHGAVLCLQWIRRVLMHGHCECRGFETLNRVARRAFAAILAGAELPAVRVSVVAIHAFLERYWPVEIASHVTQFAAHPHVLSPQGILGGGVIESLTHRRRGNLFPSRRIVAGLARRLEDAVVNVRMAVAASMESHANIFQNFRMVGRGLVALLASHAPMLTRQRVAGLRMVKLVGGLPIVETVTACAVLTQLALMPVSVTREAVPGEAQKGSVQILDLDGGFHRGRDVRRSVALLTRHAGVLPLQNIAGLTVVKSLLRRLPADELEILSVVVGVAAGAIFIARQRIPNYGVESLVRSHARGNVRVALKALQAFAAHSQSMAGDALSGAIEGLMRAGKWAGGNLGA